MNVGNYVSRKNNNLTVKVVEVDEKTKTLIYEGADGKTHSISWSSFRKSYKSEDAPVNEEPKPVEKTEKKQDDIKNNDKPVKKKSESKKSKKVEINVENLDKLKAVAKKLGCDVVDRTRGFYYKKNNKRVCETFDRKGSIFICARDENTLKAVGCSGIENHPKWNMAWSGVISYEKSEDALAYIINNFHIDEKKEAK